MRGAMRASERGAVKACCQTLPETAWQSIHAGQKRLGAPQRHCVDVMSGSLPDVARPRDSFARRCQRAADCRCQTAADGYEAACPRDRTNGDPARHGVPAEAGAFCSPPELPQPVATWCRVDNWALGRRQVGDRRLNSITLGTTSVRPKTPDSLGSPLLCRYGSAHSFEWPARCGEVDGCALVCSRASRNPVRRRSGGLHDRRVAGKLLADVAHWSPPGRRDGTGTRDRRATPIPSIDASRTPSVRAALITS
jgi:hypothetical protein